MEIYNGTQHTVNIYSINDTVAIQDGRKLVLKEGAQPLVIVPAGKNLNCQKGNLPTPSFESVVPLKGAVTFLSYEPIPSEAKGKIVVVSNLYLSAVKELGGDTSLLATVDGVVYTDESAKQPCGCLALAVG